MNLPSGMSKRHFFQTSLTAMGALALSRSMGFGEGASEVSGVVGNGAETFKPFKFLHYSDVHCAARITNNGNYNVAQMREMLRDASRHPYELVIDTGDLANTLWDENTEIRCHKAMLGFAKAPVYKTPGNHDVGNHYFIDPKKPDHPPSSPETVLKRLEKYRRVVGPDYITTVHNNCTFIGVNSTIFGHPIPDVETQWVTLEKDLAKAVEEKRSHIIIFTHYLLGFEQGWGSTSTIYYVMQEPSRSRLLSLVSKYKVSAVINGHIHKYSNFEKTLDNGHVCRFIHCPPTSFTRDHVGYIICHVDEKGVTGEQFKIVEDYGRKWNEQCKPEETNRANWDKMATSWQLRYMEAPLPEAELIEMSLKGKKSEEGWETVKLPLVSAPSGWLEANMKGDKNVLMYCPFNYSPKENGMILVNYFGNTAADIYLNGHRVFHLDEIDLKTDGKDHHKINLLALDPSDFADGQNYLVVMVQKPEKIQSMAFDLVMRSAKNVERPNAKIKGAGKSKKNAGAPDGVKDKNEVPAA